MSRKPGHIAIAWIAAAMLLLLWELAAHLVGREILVPKISRVLEELYLFLADPEVLKAMGITLGRIFLSFAICLGLTLLVGIPAGLWKPVEMAIKPVETMARSIPTMGIILLAIIWLGCEGTPLFVALLILFPILYRSLVEGIHSIDEKLIVFHRIHKVPFFKRLRCFYLPCVFPFLRAGSITSLGLCFKVIIAAEVLSQPRYGIGTIFQIERSRLNTAGVMALCILLIVLSAAFEYLFKKTSGKDMQKKQDKS